MSVGPVDLALIEARLQAQVDTLQFIGGAADRAAVKAVPSRLPAAYVLEGTETSKPAEGGSSLHIQRTDCQFGLLLCSRNYRASERGAAGRALERILIEDIREALIGWQIDSFTAAINHVSGRLLAYDQQVRWHLSTYSLGYAIRR